MSTNLSRLSELNTLKPNALYPVSALPGTSSDASATRLRSRFPSRFEDLGIVIERLFAFYEAMRLGKPVGNCDEMLGQVRGALARSTRGRNHV
jgi:hypothetical protein